MPNSTIETRPKNYCMIKNDIVLALAKTHLSPYESQVLWAIIRKTYGFIEKDGSRKVNDWISLSQLKELTEITQNSHVCRTLKLLLLKRIITKGGNKIGINKNVASWVKLPKGVNTHHPKKLPKGVIGVTKGGNWSYPQGNLQKKLLQKKLLQKNIHAPSNEGRVIPFKRLPLEKQTIIHRLCYHLEDLLGTKIVNWGKQGKAIKQMQRAGYTEEEIKKVITYMAKKDEFFSDKGFDMVTVSNSISRYKAMAVRRQNV